MIIDYSTRISGWIGPTRPMRRATFKAKTPPPTTAILPRNNNQKMIIHASWGGRR
jgi:hypothetical protein